MEYRKCTKCGQAFELTDENFYRQNGKYVWQCKPCRRKKQKKYQSEHKEEQSKRFDKWHQQNKDHANNRRKKWRENNLERKKEYQLDYQRKNKNKMREYSKYKTFHKKHQITKIQWVKCKEYFNNACAYCGLPLNEHWITYKGIRKLGDFCKDHKDDNGSNGLDNCVPACKSCNSKKWKYDFDDWYNIGNKIFSQNRYDKIINWTTNDYKQAL